MKKVKWLILGSGIGGLSFAAELKSKGENDFLVVDKAPSLPMNLHNGLHYLHSADFGAPFPFEFKEIPMTEEIWDTRTNTFKKSATIPEMFEYSRKIMEDLRHPSSIMDPGKRQKVWLPMSNDMNDLIKHYYNYVGEEKFIWNMENDKIHISSESNFIAAVFKNGECIEFLNAVSTIPLNVFYKICELKCPYELKNKTLYITNYETTNIVPNWLIGLYMSDPKFPPHRITVLNNLLSMESFRELANEDEIIIRYLIGDLFDYELSSKTTYKWETGRIFGIQKPERKEIVKFFMDRNIFLMGRFSLWNGKLLLDSTIRQARNIVNNILNNKGREELIEYLSN